MIATYTPRSGQSIYDVCLQIYGTLDLLKNGRSALLQLIIDNGLGNINVSNLKGIVLNFNTDLVADNSIFNNNSSNGVFYASDIPSGRSFNSSFEISFK